MRKALFHTTLLRVPPGVCFLLCDQGFARVHRREQEALAEAICFQFPYDPNLINARCAGDSTVSKRHLNPSTHAQRGPANILGPSRQTDRGRVEDCLYFGEDGSEEDNCDDEEQDAQKLRNRRQMVNHDTGCTVTTSRRQHIIVTTAVSAVCQRLWTKTHAIALNHPN